RDAIVGPNRPRMANTNTIPWNEYASASSSLAPSTIATAQGIQVKARVRSAQRPGLESYASSCIAPSLHSRPCPASAGRRNIHAGAVLSCHEELGHSSIAAEHPVPGQPDDDHRKKNHGQQPPEASVGKRIIVQL